MLLPRAFFIDAIVIPGAIDIITLSSVTTLTIFLSTVGYICGFTASTIYLALLPHSALLSANRTPVSDDILSHFSLSGDENIISDGENAAKAPLSIAYPMLPIPIKPILAICISSQLYHDI